MSEAEVESAGLQKERHVGSQQKSKCAWNSDRPSGYGRSLYQGSFFFCTVKAIGDIPGPGPIYVEIAVDRDSGMGFAKVYAARSPMNAVDLLESRVFPSFENLGEDIKQICTPRTKEYCGIILRHAFDTFLVASHIQHVVIETSNDPYYYLCEQFYRFLLKEFFRLELRTKFQLSIEELQWDLDEFIGAYNSGPSRGRFRSNATEHACMKLATGLQRREQ